MFGCSCTSDLINLLNGHKGILCYVPVISLRSVSLLLKLKCFILLEKGNEEKQARWWGFVTINPTQSKKTILLKLLSTLVMSFPCAALYALVHFTLRGFLFILKFLWHFDLQNRKICKGEDNLLVTESQYPWKTKLTWCFDWRLHSKHWQNICRLLIY